MVTESQRHRITQKVEDWRFTRRRGVSPPYHAHRPVGRADLCPPPREGETRTSQLVTRNSYLHHAWDAGRNYARGGTRLEVSRRHVVTLSRRRERWSLSHSVTESTRKWRIGYFTRRREVSPPYQARPPVGRADPCPPREGETRTSQLVTRNSYLHHAWDAGRSYARGGTDSVRGQSPCPPLSSLIYIVQARDNLLKLFRLERHQLRGASPLEMTLFRHKCGSVHVISVLNFVRRCLRHTQYLAKSDPATTPAP